ncbi:MAG: hypothetical protein ACI4VM_01285 [Anaerovoracaceae bacterium]
MNTEKQTDAVPGTAACICPADEWSTLPCFLCYDAENGDDSELK